MSKNDFGSIQGQINAIPSEDPPCAEGLIRSIDKMVNSHRDKEERKILEKKLKKAAIRGLGKELQTAMNSNGLALEALPLVREHLTTKTALASFFADTPDENLTKDVKMIRRKLGETLEIQFESSQFKSIKEKIENLPKNDPTNAEELIREIEVMISNVHKEKERKSLESNLKKAALLGLSVELQDIMKSNGLALNGLPLIREHLTTKADLAAFIVENCDENLPADMKMIKRRLGKTLKEGYQSSDYKSVKKRIDELPKSDPTSAEELIREIEEMINALPKADDKKSLESDLKREAILGLSEELQGLLKSNGLALSGLPLVREHLTTKPKLAKFLFEKNENDLEEDFKNIHRLLQPELEVLGELISRGFDPSDENVKKLVDIAPSRGKLKRLSTDKLRDLNFEDEDLEAINDAKDTSDVSDKKKEEREKQVTQAKELLNDVKNDVNKNFEKTKSEVKDNMEELRSRMELPDDWKQQQRKCPESMLDTLKSKTQEQGEFVESSKSFERDEEIVEKASGGLALKGINYLHWDYPKTAMLPILERPRKVDIWNAQSPYETGFRQFSEGNAAARFTKEVESSGFTHADSVSFSFGGFSAGASVSYGSQNSDEAENSMKSNSTSVSATNFCQSVMKCFAIPRDCMKVKDQAAKMAEHITEVLKEKEKQKEEIRRFFKIYGSHVPFSVHRLGGIFFTMSTATSMKEMETSKLMHLNSNKLTTEVSVGYWGAAASDKHEEESSKGSTTANQDEQENVSYTFSLKSIGPHADTPASFKKALSENNSTWAILDRGDTSLDVPVWELLRERDKKFEGVADLMRETFTKDKDKMEKEKEKIKESKEYQKRFGEMHKDQLETFKRKILKEEVNQQMGRYKEMSTAESEKHFKGQLPLKGIPNKDEFKNGEPVCVIYIENKEILESKIYDFLIIDPSSNFCQLIEEPSYSEHVAVLKCFKANKTIVGFEESSKKKDERHYIFFSGNYFSYQCTFPLYLKHAPMEALIWQAFLKSMLKYTK